MNLQAKRGNEQADAPKYEGRIQEVPAPVNQKQNHADDRKYEGCANMFFFHR